MPNFKNTQNVPKSSLTELQSGYRQREAAYWITKDAYGRTPLHKAAACGCIDRVPSHSVTVENLLICDNSGCSVLREATLNGHLNQVPNTLLTAATMLATNESGQTMLHFAALVCHLDQVPEGLVSVENLLAEDLYGNTVLHWPLPWAPPEGFLDQFLGLDFGDNAKLREVVGLEWWEKNAALLKQKAELAGIDEAPDIAIF